MPEPVELYSTLLEALSAKYGAEVFRNLHLEVLLLLAVAQVPVSQDLFKSWGVPGNQLGFALFELRDLLSSDGEGSQYDALFTGEHYSLRSADLRTFLLENPDWRDRVSDCHRRAVAAVWEKRRLGALLEPPQDIDYYSRAFAQYHLAQSGRLGDLSRLLQDSDMVESCVYLGRAAREHGYDEICLQLFLVAAQIMEALKPNKNKYYQMNLAEIYIDCCQELTNQGRYADSALFGEKALEMLRPLLVEEKDSQLEALFTHCLLCLADPYLYMGYVQQAYPLYAEAHQRNNQEIGAEQAKTIHALRGLARASRALNHIEDSRLHGEAALELARKLTREEGEEWAHYLLELLLEQFETMRAVHESLPESPGPLELMGIRWESLRLLREAEELYQRFSWPGDQELISLYLEQSMALFDLEKWSKAEECLSKAISVINSLPESDSNPAYLASLEFLRSHALALMNRIGEASGSLASLLTPELMQEMDVSERALVLFFRGKILSHQGLLLQAQAALDNSIADYVQAISLGAEDLFLELMSARIFKARVMARRGRLDEALDLCHECYQQLTKVDQEMGFPALEVVDVSELEAWILQNSGRFDEALLLCERAGQALAQIHGSETEADVETEQSLNLVTRALVLSGLQRHQEAIKLALKAVDIEQRRAQEGYEQAKMWVSIHRFSLAKLQRKAGQVEAALKVVQQAWEELSSLPANQQNHLGLHLATVQMEMALCYLDLEQWKQVRQPLQQACILYENEMWQGKEYLVAVLLDCHRHWLEFCRLSSNADWLDRSCWMQFFEGWMRWQPQMVEEMDNVFLQQARERLKQWIAALPLPVQEEWNCKAPASLQTTRL